MAKHDATKRNPAGEQFVFSAAGGSADNYRAEGTDILNGEYFVMDVCTDAESTARMLAAALQLAAMWNLQPALLQLEQENRRRRTHARHLYRCLAQLVGGSTEAGVAASMALEFYGEEYGGS